MRTLVPVILIVIVLILVAVLIMNHSRPTISSQVNTNTNQSNLNPSPNPGSRSAGLPFHGSEFEPYAHKIAPGPLSSDAKIALTGFNFSSQDLADGSVQVTLTAMESGYQTQQYIVKPGYTLYFIDNFPSDDMSGSNRDANLSDDTAILVDQSGFIVPQR